MADTSALRRAVADRALEIAEQAIEITYRETVEAAPERSGALRHLIDTDPPTLNDLVVRTRIFCDAPYAGYTDAGTEPHRIPGNPLLSFYWENGPDGPGDYVFAYVDHPGTSGTQWFTGGQTDGEPMVTRWAQACAEAAAA